MQISASMENLFSSLFVHNIRSIDCYSTALAPNIEKEEILLTKYILHPNAFLFHNNFFQAQNWHEWTFFGKLLTSQCDPIDLLKKLWLSKGVSLILGLMQKAFDKLYLSLSSVSTNPIRWTTLIPDFTRPNIVCFLSRLGFGSTFCQVTK